MNYNVLLKLFLFEFRLSKNYLKKMFIHLIMAIWLQGSVRKPSGGRYHHSKPKKKMHLGRNPALTKVGEKKVKKIRVLGGNYKLRALSLDKVNVNDRGKTICAKIIDVMENPANRHYVRMDVITKGAILKTDKGYVKVTNRPGQEGVINGVFVEYSETKEIRKTSKNKEKIKKKHKDKKDRETKKEEKREEAREDKNSAKDL